MNLSSSQKCFLMPLSFGTLCLFFVESPILTPSYIPTLICVSGKLLFIPPVSLKAAAAPQKPSQTPRLTLTLFSAYHYALFRLHFEAHPCFHFYKLLLITRLWAPRNQGPYHFTFVSQNLAQCLLWEVFNKKI